MRCGISTACFYPEDTLASLRRVVAAGAPVTEVFLNTFSELEENYLAQLAAVLKDSGTRAVSVHPFSSAMEGFFFASRYAARTVDGMALYRRYFEACARLGADKLVFHGDHAAAGAHFPLEEYAERFCALAEAGRKYGVTLCHENVSYCRLGDPGAVTKIRPLLGEYAAFVLDTKQAHRFGVPVGEMLEAMGRDIHHVHISDANEVSDCLAPGRGNFDFAVLLAQLKKNGYAGDLIIELYREGFGPAGDLVVGMEAINALLQKQRQ